MSSKTGKNKATTSRKIFVLDTNVLLHDPNSLLKFGEHDVFIPFVTLEELDNKKVGTSDLNRHARQATRLIEEIITQDEGSMAKGFELKSFNGGHATGKLYVQGQALPFLEHEHLHKNDNLYLSVLDFLVKNEGKTDTPREVLMVTKDINLRIKARGMGFIAQDYMHDHVVDDADMLYSGIVDLPKEPFEYSDQVESWKEGKKVFYKVPNQNWVPNEFLRTPSEKMYQVIDLDLESNSAILEPVHDYTVEKNSVYGICARNEEQQAAMALLLDPEVDFVTLLGPAGTGKTLLTVATGLRLIADNVLDEMIFTRATIPLGEDIGFLPGSEEEKMAPWAGALFDNIEVLSEIMTEKSPSEAVKFTENAKSKVKVKAITFMRGRTLNRKFLVIDEAQNLTPKQMKALITRAGEGTKVVCLGNLAQIDSPYLSETSSGLAYAVEKFKGWAHFGALVLKKGERSRLANEGNERL